MSYHRIANRVEQLLQEQCDPAVIISTVVRDLAPGLAHPSEESSERRRLQSLRDAIARAWAEDLNKLEGVCWLTGWLLNERHPEADALGLAASLLALDAIRSTFAILSQIRAAPPVEAFVHLRTLYEAAVTGRFIRRHAGRDPELPRRFLGHVLTK